MRTNQIRYVRTLEYYEGILLFEARDPVGATYAASHIRQEPEGDLYLVVACDPERLSLLRHGVGSLRDLLQASAPFGWCLAVLTSLDEPLTVIEDIATSSIPDGYLPEAGPSDANYEADHEVSERAKAEHNTVVQLYIDPPKTVRKGLVPATTLVGLLRRIELLAQQAAVQATIIQNEGRGLESSVRKNLGQLEVVEIARGSVKITLQELNIPNPKEKSPLTLALEYTDSLFESVSDSDEIAETVKAYHPGVVNSFASLVRFLRDQKTGFSYTWSTPSTHGISHQAISLDQARELARRLPKLESGYLVSQRGIFLEGILEMADKTKKTWRLNDLRSGARTGFVDENGPDLASLVIGNRYVFSCREETRMDERKGQEVTRLYLGGIPRNSGPVYTDLPS